MSEGSFDLLGLYAVPAERLNWAHKADPIVDDTLCQNRGP